MGFGVKNACGRGPPLRSLGREELGTDLKVGHYMGKKVTVRLF